MFPVVIEIKTVERSYSALAAGYLMSEVTKSFLVLSPEALPIGVPFKIVATQVEDSSKYPQLPV